MLWAADHSFLKKMLQPIVSPRLLQLPPHNINWMSEPRFIAWSSYCILKPRLRLSPVSTTLLTNRIVNLRSALFITVTSEGGLGLQFQLRLEDIVYVGLHIYRDVWDTFYQSLLCNQMKLISVLHQNCAITTKLFIVNQNILSVYRFVREEPNIIWCCLHHKISWLGDKFRVTIQHNYESILHLHVRRYNLSHIYKV